MTSSQACAACGRGPLRHHLGVRPSAGASLVATTTSYGRAPSDIVRCGSCGHMQVSRFPAEVDLDEGYAEVREDAYLDEEAGQRATANRALDLIERYTDRGAICDLGCWVGFLLSEAERRGWEVWGVEPSSFAAGFARERLGLNVQSGKLQEAELPPKHFHAVAMGDVIEHLPNPGEALARISGLLQSQGVLYLALPDAGSRVARSLGSRWWSVLPTHVQYFTRHSLVRLLSRHGFTTNWIGSAPKAFTVRYYLERLEGYSAPLANSAVRVAQGVGVAERLVWPDFRDRMAVVARLSA